MRSQIDAIAGYADRLVATLAAYENELEHQENTIAAANADIVTSKKAVAFVQAVASDTQKQFEVSFSRLVSAALSTIFGPDAYEFRAVFVERRGRMECDFVLERDGETISPEDAVGGGVMDILSMALRIAYWSLKKTAPVFILDEPFKFLSPSHHAKASALLEFLSKKLGIQFIVVSHQTGMVERADAVWKVVNGKTGRISL